MKLEKSVKRENNHEKHKKAHDEYMDHMNKEKSKSKSKRDNIKRKEKERYSSEI